MFDIKKESTKSLLISDKQKIVQNNIHQIQDQNKGEGRYLKWLLFYLDKNYSL